MFTADRDQIVALAKRYSVVTMYELREYVTAGGLISYGASGADMYRQAGNKSVYGFDPCDHCDIGAIVGAVTEKPVVGSLRQSCLAQALNEADAVLRPPERRRYPVKIAEPQRGIDLAQAGHRR